MILSATNWARISEVLHSQGIASKAMWAVHMAPPSVDKWNWSSGIGGKWFAGFCIGLYGKYIQNVFNCRATQNISYVCCSSIFVGFFLFNFKSLIFAFLIFGTHFFYQFAFKFSTLQLCSQLALVVVFKGLSQNMNTLAAKQFVHGCQATSTDFMQKLNITATNALNHSNPLLLRHNVSRTVASTDWNTVFGNLHPLLDW